MRSVYRVLAYLVAAEVVVQAAAVAYAVAGLGHWVDGGGVLDSATMESDDLAFPEVVGFIVHGINGMMVVPALALLLLIFSFFAKVRGGVQWAALVLLLVVVQVVLGIAGHGVPALGGLHGLNALLLFLAALYAGRRAGAAGAATSAATEPPARAEAPA